MAPSAKDTLKDVGHKLADTAKNVGISVMEKAGHAAEWVKEKTGLEHHPMSAANMADITPNMEVISSCGCRMGTVDHMENGAIKLTRRDSPDGQHHYLPTGWVARVDDRVYLNKNAEETRQGWKPYAAACGCCGA